MTAELFQNMSGILHSHKINLLEHLTKSGLVFHFLLTRESPPSGGLRSPFGSGRGGNLKKKKKFFLKKFFFDFFFQK